jgi:transposase-like protein
VLPLTVIRTCIVHLIRHLLEFVSWKDRNVDFSRYGSMAATPMAGQD